MWLLWERERERERQRKREKRVCEYVVCRVSDWPTSKLQFLHMVMLFPGRSDEPWHEISTNFRKINPAPPIWAACCKQPMGFCHVRVWGIMDARLERVKFQSVGLEDVVSSDGGSLCHQSLHRRCDVKFWYHFALHDCVERGALIRLLTSLSGHACTDTWMVATRKCLFYFSTRFG